jgi:hypothetical protein
MTVNIRLAGRREMDPATDSVLRRTWAGWDPAASDDEVWAHNRGRYRFSSRIDAERLATLSYGGTVRVVAELTGPPESAPRPGVQGETWALVGRVLGPGDAAYEALVGTEVPWSRGVVRYLPDPDLPA